VFRSFISPRTTSWRNPNNVFNLAKKFSTGMRSHERIRLCCFCSDVLSAWRPFVWEDGTWTCGSDPEMPEIRYDDALASRHRAWWPAGNGLCGSEAIVDRFVV
jgi:hypothetical protein